MSKKSKEQARAIVAALASYRVRLDEMSLSALEDELDELEDEIAELEYRRDEWFDVKSKFGPTAGANIITVSLSIFAVSMGWLVTSNRLQNDVWPSAMEALGAFLGLAISISTIVWSVAGWRLQKITNELHIARDKRRAVRRAGRAEMAAQQSLASQPGEVAGAVVVDAIAPSTGHGKQHDGEDGTTARENVAYHGDAERDALRVFQREKRANRKDS